MSKCHLVRQMKRYDAARVTNALGQCSRRGPKRGPAAVEKLCTGVPRCDLEKALYFIKNDGARSKRVRRWLWF